MGKLVRRLVISLVVLGGIFVGANVVATNVASDRIAKAAQTSFDLEQLPDVTLDGFPILLRVLTGTLPGLSFDATDVTIEGLTFRSVSVRMRDIRAEGGLLRTADLQVVIGSGEVRAEAIDAAVNAFLEERDEDATIAFAPGGRATVRATRRFAGARREIVATGAVTLDAEQQRLVFDPEEVTVDGGRANRLLEIEAKRRSRIVVELPRLPGNLRITALETAEGSVALTTVVRDLEFPIRDGGDEEAAAAPAREG